MEIRKYIISAICLIGALSINAQTAKQVLDKTAATVSAKNGAQANFTINGQSMNASGTIAIKGKKFHATTPQATIWFDGKTQWTYMKNNDEVNISNPTESQLAAINPYNFVHDGEEERQLRGAPDGHGQENHSGDVPHHWSEVVHALTDTLQDRKGMDNRRHSQLQGYQSG